jgi:hypothetical protein
VVAAAKPRLKSLKTWTALALDCNSSEGDVILAAHAGTPVPDHVGSWSNAAAAELHDDAKVEKAIAAIAPALKSPAGRLKFMEEMRAAAKQLDKAAVALEHDEVVSASSKRK